MIKETIEHHDAPTQIVEQEETNDSSRLSDHKSPSTTQPHQITPSSITQPPQTTPASIDIDNATIIEKESNTIGETVGVPINEEESKDTSEDAAVPIHETAGVSFQEATEENEENMNTDEDAAVFIHNTNGTKEESTGMSEANKQEEKETDDDMKDITTEVSLGDSLAILWGYG
eukprot:3239850-Ditylum_brightwellii.AAC.1